MNTQQYISGWLKDYATKANKDGFTVGVSGGVDSATVSTLCALTGLTTYCLMMPINQAHDQVVRAYDHVKWLSEKFSNVKFNTVPLNKPFDELNWVFPPDVTDLALANTKSRLRMITLYAYATSYNLLVAGTGNKIEDFCVGFYSKWGDGAVDLSPIASLTKTQVWELARELGINHAIIDAKPTDGLWNFEQSDEDQIGASYPELEFIMYFLEEQGVYLTEDAIIDVSTLTERQKQVLSIYTKFHLSNKHKMLPIPVCPLP
jgi:NAD+ synthase